MQSNRCLVFFLFGLSMLPKIYSDVFPSLVLVKKTHVTTTRYDLFHGIINSRHGEGLVEFYASPKYLRPNNIYNACPVEDEGSHWANVLEIKEKMTNLQPTTLQQFVEGLFGEYDCEREIKPVALKYQPAFGDEFEGFQQYHIGFLVKNNAYVAQPYKNAANEPLPQVYGLVKILTVTLDTQLGTIYSVHHEILSGKFLQPDLVFHPLPVYEINTEEYGFDVDSLYTEENQQNILSSIFGQFNPEHSLIKVQLAPHKDFLLHTWKLSSFMNLNTTSMWRQTYPQWKKIEKFVRKVARKLGDLSVETGTAQILTLSNIRNQQQPVYLGRGQKFAVFKYVWKQIIINPDPKDIRGILIVMHNDPYTPNQERICNERQNFGWLVSNNEFDKGLTYVCPLHEDTRSKLDNKLELLYPIFKLNDSLELDDDEDDSDEDEEMR